MFPQLEFVLVGLVEQVSDFLVVDLEEGRGEQKFGLGADGGRLEKLLQGAGDDAPLAGRLLGALHRETLAAPRLPVRENRAVVPLRNTLEKSNQKFIFVFLVKIL